jgi:hypothetical protein
MEDLVAIAGTIPDACIEAAMSAYEDAGISGICAEGRWAIAIQAMRGLDVQPLVSGALEQASDQ